MPRCLFSPHPNPLPQGEGILLVPKLQLSPLCTSRPNSVISAGMPKSSVQGWQHWATTDVPISKDIQLRAFKRTYQAFAQPTGYRPWPGFRHPCRNDGFSGLPALVNNDELDRTHCAIVSTDNLVTPARSIPDITLATMP